MSLRQHLRRQGAAAAAAAMRRNGGGLLEVLRAELKDELSSTPTPDPSPSQVGNSVGKFKVEWDDPRAQDVVLRRRRGEAEGEEVVVSAILAPMRFRDDFPLPRNALMKVCVKKPQSDPTVNFNCEIFRREAEIEENGGGSDTEFAIRSAYYYPSLALLGAKKYRGPWFSSLDPQLQDALKEYLVERGIGMELNNFLLEYLHKKEQAQYINWLRTLEHFITKG